MTENQLTVIPPQELVRQSTDIAGLCKEIVLKCANDINGKKYVRVEGWQAIAVAHGCTASARNVEKIEGGIRAIGEVKRMTDGAVISSAEGFVGDDEKKWADGAEYARRAMAQTRAISRACRSAFAHVVVLMDAGLSTTPAEEVPYGGFHDDEQREKDAAANRNAPVEATRVHFGKNKGKAVSELNGRQLAWYRDNYEEQVKEGKRAPSNSDTALYEAVKAEIAKRKTPEQKPDDDDELPMFNGPNHKNLAGQLAFASIEVEEFLEAMREVQMIPLNKMTFDKMPEEMAAKFVNDFESVETAVKAYRDKKR